MMSRNPFRSLPLSRGQFRFQARGTLGRDMRTASRRGMLPPGLSTRRTRARPSSSRTRTRSTSSWTAVGRPSWRCLRSRQEGGSKPTARESRWGRGAGCSLVWRAWRSPTTRPTCPRRSRAATTRTSCRSLCRAGRGVHRGRPRGGRVREPAQGRGFKVEPGQTDNVNRPLYHVQPFLPVYMRRITLAVNRWACSQSLYYQHHHPKTTLAP